MGYACNSGEYAVSITFKAVEVAEEMEQFLSLGFEHYAEVEERSEEHEFVFAMDTIKKYFDMGFVACTLAFDGDKPVGYFLNTLAPDIFSESVVAKEIALFVLDDYRGQGIAKELIALFEEMMLERGIGLCMLTFKAGHNEAFPLSIGYRLSEIIYEKILPRSN